MLKTSMYELYGHLLSDCYAVSCGIAGSSELGDLHCSWRILLRSRAKQHFCQLSGSSEKLILNISSWHWNFIHKNVHQFIITEIRWEYFPLIKCIHLCCSNYTQKKEWTLIHITLLNGWYHLGTILWYKTSSTFSCSVELVLLNWR